MPAAAAGQRALRGSFSKGGDELWLREFQEILKDGNPDLCIFCQATGASLS